MLALMKRAGVILILLFSFIGLADSVYLAKHEANGTPLLCNIQNLSGCNIVAQSPYSKLLGIPLAEYGVLFYTILFILAALEIVIFDQLLRRALQGLSVVGLIASVGFTVLQIFVIKALCVYCLLSALMTLFIFIAASYIEPLRRTFFTRDTPPSEPPSSRPPLPMPPR